MFAFGNPVVGGIVLVRPAIQSPGYVAGVSGWTVRIDGSAEFNNLTIRGTFAGSDFVVNSAGIFLYGGPPGPGNLVGSWAPAGGADQYGNSYPAGLRIWQAGGAGTLLSGASLVLLGAGSTTSGFIQTQRNGSGAGSTSQTTISGASDADHVPQIVMLGESGNAASDARLILQVYSLSAAMAIAGAIIQAGGQVVATQPGSISAAAPEGIPETWHTLGSPGTTGCTVNVARYRLTALGECEIDISLSAGAAGSTAGLYTWSVALPTGYQFPSGGAGAYSRAYAMGWGGTTAAGDNTAILQIDGAGTGNPGRVRMQLPAKPSGTQFSITAQIPLS